MVMSAKKDSVEFIKAADEKRLANNPVQFSELELREIVSSSLKVNI